MKQVTPLPLRGVRLSDGLALRMQRLVREKVIPYQWAILNDRLPDVFMSHCIENFRIAAGLSRGERSGMVFLDSDLYKWLEAVAYSLETQPDPALEAMADEACALIRSAQQPDGYLNTYYTVCEPDKRFTNLQQGHELYCAGHFFEAAVAYAHATGKRDVLDTACRFADCLTRTFGEGDGRNPGYPGHQEVEVGLVKLYEATGREDYLKLARYFIHQRGKRPLYFEAERRRPDFKDFFGQPVLDLPTYAQTHAEPVQQTEAVGHAVRALYMYSSMADLAALENDEALARACGVLYRSVTNRRMYVTGGVGSTAVGESFTGDFDLPNDTVYSESCASVALMMFASRMTALTGQGAYYDTVERAFFNRVLAGISQTGTAFFYVSPLAVDPDFCRENPGLEHVKPVRQRWFDVACCPTNIARTIMSIGGYAYGQDGEALYIHMPLAGEVREGPHALRVATAYPFGNRVTLTALADGQQVRLRSGALAPVRALRLNGEPLTLTPQDGYLRLPTLRRGDCVEAELDMTAHPVVAHARVTADAGKATVMRGPIVYCAEQADNGPGVASLALPAYPEFEEEDALTGDGAVALRARGAKAVYPGGDALYCNGSFDWHACDVRLIPYHLWANRGEGEMRVYLNVR